MAINSKNWCDVHRINFPCERTCEEGAVACPECLKAVLLKAILAIQESVQKLFQDLIEELKES